MPNPIKRGNSWQAKIRQQLPDGTVEKISRTFDTEKECAAFIEAKVKEIEGGKRDNKVERETSFSMMLDRFEKEILNPDVERTEKAKSQVRSVIRKWKKVPWASYPLTSITSLHISNWKRDQVEAKAAGSTIANAMNTLSGIFKAAQGEWGFAIANPVKTVKRPKAGKPRSAHLSADEEVQLIAACDQGPPYLVWSARIALVTAMRAGEIRRLKWEDVDLEGLNIHVCKSKNNEERDITLSLIGAAKVFQDLKEAGLPMREDGYIFGDPDLKAAEGGITESMLTAAFSNAADRAGLGHLTFHDLRHVATTRLAPFHRDAIDLQRTTGHKTLAMVARYFNETKDERNSRLAQAEADRIELKQIREARALAEAKAARKAKLKPNLSLVT